MSTSTHAARYAADHIETGEGDEACSECDGEAERIDATGRVHACRACGGRGLVAASAHAYPAPTDEQLRAMTGPELQAEIADTMRSRFWTFSQNNSGGQWAAGMPKFLIVEAFSACDANNRAITAGAYFNGCASGMDCRCCGDRWYMAFEALEDGDAEPSVFGVALEHYRPVSWEHRYRRTDGTPLPLIRVVYMDGRVEEHCMPGASNE